MRKIICSLAILSFNLPLMSIFLAPAVSAATVDEAEIVSPLATDTVHFVMTVKWGNVLGEVQEKTESNFDGSISGSSISGSSAAKISLIKTLLFDQHNDNADKIISERNPVSWRSLIYGHWDGVRVLVSSPASNNIAVSVTAGTITKTAKELYETREPIIQDLGNGKEIVIETHPVRSHAFAAKLIWGKTDRAEYEATSICAAGAADVENALSVANKTACLKYPKADLSGSLILTGGAKMKLIRTLRFEKSDAITNRTDNNIAWNSTVSGGVDGVLVKFVLDRNMNMTDNTSVALAFSQQGYQKSISLTDLYHKKIIKDQIAPGYGIYVSIWSFPDRALIKAKNNPKVYMMENGLRRHIPNPQVFADQGLDWGEVEEVEADEVEILPESDPLSYSEGTLVQGTGSEVYAISNNQKRHITNPQVFANLQYNWKNIAKVTNAELSLYSTGASITAASDHPDNTLVRVANQPTVYVVEGDKLKPVTSPQAFESNNFRWDRIKTITAAVKNKYKIGNAVALGDGALISDPSGKVYRIDQGKKRLVRTADDFIKAGFDWSKVINISASEAVNLAEGEDIVSDDVR